MINEIKTTKMKSEQRAKGLSLILSAVLSVVMPIFVLLKTPVEKSSDVPLPPWTMPFLLTLFTFIFFGSITTYHLVGYIKIKRRNTST